MKKYIILTLLNVFLAVALYGQNIVNKQFSLLNYDLNLTTEFREDLQSLEPFFSSVEVHNKDSDDRLKAIMIHHIYYHVKENLEEDLEINILPINTFMQEVKYNDFGYPKTHINKALRVGDSRYYFKLDVTFDSMTEERKKNDPKLQGNIIFPHITIDITVYDDNGVIPVDKWHGEKITYKPYEINKRFFRQFVKDTEIPSKPQLEENEEEQESLFQLYDAALNDLIINFLEK